MFDRLRPGFRPGRRGAFFAPLFDAVEDFFYSPESRTSGCVHLRRDRDLKRLMSLVIVSLLPCTAAALWNTGRQALLASGADAGFWPSLFWGARVFLPVYLVTLAVGGAWEVLFALVRRREIGEGFFVTSLLFPLILPPSIPLWQVACGISFGVVIGKELFGGTGRNLVNPALAGRVFLTLSFPRELSGDRVWTAAARLVPAADAGSRATPLSLAAESPPWEALRENGISWLDCFVGNVPGSMGETSALACLLGAALLALFRVAPLRIPAGCVLGAAAGYLLAGATAGTPPPPLASLPLHYHLVTGGFLFGAVFMTTDPVTAPVTRFGKWIYGFLIGFACMAIRIFNPVYPEGMSFAVLLMNVFAPLIDYFVLEYRVSRRSMRRAYR
jgi:Na+-transporting NADH:ubiquinone oxidoreductase subunit B